MQISGFDWDSGNWPKCGKHGVSRAEIEQMFAHARVAADPGHSWQEVRQIAVGRNVQGRALFVAFTTRLRGGQLLIRPLSARYMHAKEVQRYEAGSPFQY